MCYFRLLNKCGLLDLNFENVFNVEIVYRFGLPIVTIIALNISKSVQCIIGFWINIPCILSNVMPLIIINPHQQISSVFFFLFHLFFFGYFHPAGDINAINKCFLPIYLCVSLVNNNWNNCW